MRIHLLKSKIHRARITEARLDYEGSLGIDSDLMRQCGFFHYEKILCANLSTGGRFETYVIPAPAGSRSFVLNGAAARLGTPGDLLTIMAFAEIDIRDVERFEPQVLTLESSDGTILLPAE